jgi:uncharacterized protein (DUF433 family)
MNLPDFLAHVDGEIRVTGTRMGLYHLLYDYNQGDSAETLAEQYPTVPLATVHKVIAFYLENKAEVDQYLSEYQAELDRQRAVGRYVDMDELRRRFAEKYPSRVSGAEGGGTGPKKIAQ